MVEYLVKTFSDDLEHPETVQEVSGGVEAVELAKEEVKTLHNESGRFSLGTAGENELFELFPVNGFGTVVVAER
jgi:hypothetical protein